MEVSPRGGFCFILKHKLGQIPFATWKCFFLVSALFLSATKLSSTKSYSGSKVAYVGFSLLIAEVVAAVLWLLLWAEECFRELLSELALPQEQVLPPSHLF